MGRESEWQWKLEVACSEALDLQLSPGLGLLQGFPQFLAKAFFWLVDQLPSLLAYGSLKLFGSGAEMPRSMLF